MIVNPIGIIFFNRVYTHKKNDRYLAGRIKSIMTKINEKVAENDLKKEFATLLLKWNKKYNTRKMPWKGEKVPYKIWLSEIILQQTRVEQGLKYYNKFIKTFPTIDRLANAQDQKIFKLWEGLGYYNRCRNLIETARIISNELKGNFPDSYEKIKSLKGIGPYTAAAIASFAFDLPYAVVDGNVFRVLARVFGINKPIDSTIGKTFFSDLANQLLNKKQPALYNQAIMDFGALVCKPALPHCLSCVFNKKCVAYLNNHVNELPLKEKKINIKKRYFYYFVMEYKNEVILQQRTAKDIWRQLYEFPFIEVVKHATQDRILKQAEQKGWFLERNYEIIDISPVLKQKLSHQLISGQFIRLRFNRKPTLKNDWQLVLKNNLSIYPFPGLINQYLQYYD